MVRRHASHGDGKQMASECPGVTALALRRPRAAPPSRWSLPGQIPRRPCERSLLASGAGQTVKLGHEAGYGVWPTETSTGLAGGEGAESMSGRTTGWS
jgi:hypothetical protein